MPTVKILMAAAPVWSLLPIRTVLRLHCWEFRAGALHGNSAILLLYNV